MPIINNAYNKRFFLSIALFMSFLVSVHFLEQAQDTKLLDSIAFAKPTLQLLSWVSLLSVSCLFLLGMGNMTEKKVMQ